MSTEKTLPLSCFCRWVTEVSQTALFLAKTDPQENQQILLQTETAEELNAGH